MKRKSALAINACVQKSERENELCQSFCGTYGRPWYNQREKVHPTCLNTGRRGRKPNRHKLFFLLELPMNYMNMFHNPTQRSRPSVLTLCVSATSKSAPSLFFCLLTSCLHQTWGCVPLCQLTSAACDHLVPEFIWPVSQHNIQHEWLTELRDDEIPHVHSRQPNIVCYLSR